METLRFTCNSHRSIDPRHMRLADALRQWLQPSFRLPLFRIRAPDLCTPVRAQDRDDDVRIALDGHFVDH